MRDEIFKCIERERNEQDRQWGGSQHDSEHTVEDWVAFIVKQLGLAQAANSNDEFKKRMIKVAALAVAACEAEKDNL